MRRGTRLAGSSLPTLARSLVKSQEGSRPSDVMRFAGAWEDLPDFAGFEAELKQRRREAFKSRRWQDEISADKDAGIALAHDRVVVTHNTAHFGKLPGVKVEDGSSR